MRHKLQTCTNDSDCSSGGSRQKCDNPTGGTNAGVCVGRRVISVRHQGGSQYQFLKPVRADADCYAYYSGQHDLPRSAHGFTTIPVIGVTCSNSKCVTIGAILPGAIFLF